MKHFSQFMLLPLGSVLLACGIAHAEGNQNFEGAHGVNRVIRSDADADHPRLTTAGHVELSMVQPVNRAGEFDAEVNPFNNKATAYLGGASRVLVGNGLQEFDGGLQFESGVFGNYTRGWTAFISRGNRFVTAHVFRDDTDDNIDNPVDVAWRGGSFSANKDASGKYVAATGSIGSDITFTIVPGGTTNTMVSAIGVDNNTFIWSPNGNNNANDDATKARKQNPIAPWARSSLQPCQPNVSNQ